MLPIPIDDPDDPRIAAYRDIRERDLVGRKGLFIAEGKVVLDVLFESGRFVPQSALLLESRLLGMKDVLAKAPRDMPVYVASAQVMDRIAGFPLHRGILAVGERRAPETAEAMLDRLPSQALVVVLVGIANHDNVGAIFRNAAAFGADAAILDQGCCDPLYRKAIRVSVGAALKVPFARAPSAGLADMLSQRGFTQIALSPHGQLDIHNLPRDARTALYLGSEGEGLPRDLMDRVTTVRIAMAPGFDSLNVAAASAVALHRMAGL